MIFVLFLIGPIGFFIVPFIPLTFELTCEITFPIGEAISTGLLMTGGQIIALIYVMIFLNIKDNCIHN
jgi:hypothetical protein